MFYKLYIKVATIMKDTKQLFYLIDVSKKCSIAIQKLLVLMLATIKLKHYFSKSSSTWLTLKFIDTNDTNKIFKEFVIIDFQILDY